MANFKEASKSFLKCRVHLMFPHRKVQGFSGVARGQWLSKCLPWRKSHTWEDTTNINWNYTSRLALAKGKFLLPCNYLKVRNSVAQALEGPLIVLKGSMKGNYQKIHYGEKILRDLKTEKNKEKKSQVWSSSSFLEASAGKVWKCFWLSPKMTEDEGTQHLAQSGT